ncbi:MAG: methyltransferase domain-containing protein [Notoacmeibacter sp.]|nr:methyltransferase domain-containing protein [Notoacmeibacter sp.]
MTAALGDHGRLMDGIYHRQRLIYDATRKYYLLGRDALIAGLDVQRGGSVLEIGCGTGRNLIAVGRHYPQARLYGIDISTEMLKSARAALHRAGLEDRARVTPGDATAFDTEAAFGTADFDRVFISYSLSMIPDWRLALQQAASVLAPGGQLHVVDFGQQERLPRWFRSTLHVWLAKFHVTPRGDLEGAMREIAGRIGGTLEFASPYRDYARLGVIRAPAGCWPSLPAAT